MNVMTIQSLFRSVSILALCGAAAILGGCATASKSDAMVPVSIDTTTRHAQTTTVTTAGGRETNAMGKSQISDEAFAQALVAAIEKSKTFSRVIKGAGADYNLVVSVVGMDQPSFGLSFTVKMEAAWSLKRADGTAVWQESIKSEHTATPSDAFVGTERLRMANEGAARNNIAAGLAKISKLKL
jgi:hypothetical protein